MNPPYIPIPWQFPWAGLALELDSDHIPPYALTEAQEVYFQTPAILRSRGGFDLAYTGTSGGNIKLMYGWFRDANLYYSDDTGKLWKSSSGTAITGTANNVTDMVSFGVSNTPTLIVTEEVGAQGHTLHTYDGTTYATLTGTSVPLVQRVMTRHSRLLGTAATALPSRVYYSKVNDATIWSGAWNEGGYFDIAPGDDGKIIDWIDYDGVLYVFKQAGIYACYGDYPPSYQVKKLASTQIIQTNTPKDCGARGVIYATKYGIFPLGSRRGLESYDLSLNVQGDLQAILDGCDAVYSPELGCYLVTNDTTAIWVSNHNNRPDVWTKFTAPAAVYSMYQWNKLYLGTTGGKVYEYDHDGFTDDTTAFTPSIKTGYWDMGEPLRRKNIRFLEGPFNATESADVDVSAYLDDELNSKKEWHVKRGDNDPIACNLSAKKIALEFEYRNLSAPVAFIGASLRVLPEDEIK